MVQIAETVVQRRSRRSRSRGFTLIELMIVVGVIAVLAAVVVPTFFRESGKTKSISEVTPMFTELANKLEQFKSETGRYVNTTNLKNDTPVVCPANPSKAGVNALATCVTSGSAWTTLRVNPPQARLRCSYQLQVGDAGNPLAVGMPVGITFTPPTTTGWWAILATCDGDGQGTTSTNGKFFMSSVDTTIQRVNEAL